MGGEGLPPGRRVAQWRVRRGLTQQLLADRVGKSKSWMDKVERGVRALDKVSTLQELAAALRVDASVLLGRDTQPVEVTERVEGVEQIRRRCRRTTSPSAGRPTVVPSCRPTGCPWTSPMRGSHSSMPGIRRCRPCCRVCWRLRSGLTPTIRRRGGRRWWRRTG
ncbi:helix-turn-helix domain-containing protein [Micromonospora carbonacea]|uniref:helix-turn-helix domain-containing protein n=1 Tax=Micromonospora carbonacea TaxID=47853 RepID=UPI003D9545D7